MRACIIHRQFCESPMRFTLFVVHSMLQAPFPYQGAVAFLKKCSPPSTGIMILKAAQDRTERKWLLPVGPTCNPSAQFLAPRNPPRPCASRRVEALNQHQTLQTSQNLKQAHKGEGLPSPFPLPDGISRNSVRFPGITLANLTLQKVMVKPMKNQHFRF